MNIVERDLGTTHVMLGAKLLHQKVGHRNVLKYSE